MDVREAAAVHRGGRDLCRHTAITDPPKAIGEPSGYGREVVRGVLRGGWFCANPIHVPRCPATQGTPFIVGAGPPEITVGTPSP